MIEEPGQVVDLLNSSNGVGVQLAQPADFGALIDSTKTKNGKLCVW